MTNYCSVAICKTKVLARDMCAKHYQRWSISGDPEKVNWSPEKRGTSCKVTDCIEPVKAKGMCNKHYLRHRKYGNPLTTKYHSTAEEKFLAELPENKNPEECWEWQGPINRYGYGVINAVGAMGLLAHRYSYARTNNVELVRYEQIHHICANRRCVNPDHLQSVSARENMAEMMQRNYYIRRIEQLEQLLDENGIEH